MKKIIFLIMMFSLVALNIQAAEVKIGYVDLQKIVTTSDQGKEALKTMESLEKAKGSLINEKIEAIKKLEDELTKQGAILTPEAKQKKQMEYEKLVTEYQQMRRSTEEELKKNEAEFIQKIVMDVKKLLAKISKEEGYTVILNEAVVIYIPEEYNLTDKVLKQFNALSNSTKDK